MIVPFVVLGTPVAIATFVLAPESGRRHGAADLALAEEMARRAAQIIENARLQQQLQKSEARFRVALEHSNIAVFEEDTNFRVRWTYNARFGDDSGDPGRDGGEILPFAPSAELDALKREVLRSGKGARTAVDGVVQGERRHLLIGYEPLRDVGGIAGLTGTAVDITELKRAQDELAQALAFRERMMGVLGHDLRNPLSAVLGLSKLLRLDEALPASVREGLERIEQACRRMNEMIGTLLDFTQLRALGGLPITREAVDLHEVALTVVDELRVANPRRDIVVAAPAQIRGLWDPARMAQVVSNLVGNALTHGAYDAPVQLSLSLDQHQAVLAVTNRGPAIPPELADRLFEPFQQGPSNGNGRSRGLGLGLAIVQAIVQAHGGTIGLESDDQATTFTVRLPADT
jgi:signal transduction histidine kinase